MFYSSSESDMEEEDEQDDQEEAEEQPPSPSDLGGVPWKEAVELHAKLRGDNHEEGEDEALADTGSIDGGIDEEDEEEEEDEEDEGEEDEESSEGKLVLHSRVCDSGNLFCFFVSEWPHEDASELCFSPFHVCCHGYRPHPLCLSFFCAPPSPHFITPPCPHTVFVCMCIYFFFLFLFLWAFVCPPADRGGLLALG